MAQTIAEMIRGSLKKRQLTYRDAGPIFDTTPQTVQKWATGRVIPERWRAGMIASALDKSEREVLAAMDEADRERRARQDLADQVALMREEQRRMNERIAELEERVVRILEAVRPGPSRD